MFRQKLRSIVPYTTTSCYFVSYSANRLSFSSANPFPMKSNPKSSISSHERDAILEKLRMFDKTIVSYPVSAQCDLWRAILRAYKIMFDNRVLRRWQPIPLEVLESHVQTSLARLQMSGSSSLPSSSSPSNTVSAMPSNKVLVKKNPKPSETSPLSLKRHLHGPSLDDLRKVNLGEEIEALFGELTRLREKKNLYRQQYASLRSEYEALAQSNQDLSTRCKRLGGKLTDAEMETMRQTEKVMALQSHMDISHSQREKEKLHGYDSDSSTVKKGTILSTNAQGNFPQDPNLENQLEKLRQDLHDKDVRVRSLQRRLERQRRHDMFWQFTALINRVDTLLPNPPLNHPLIASLAFTHSMARRSSAEDELFHHLHQIYHTSLRESWNEVVLKKATGARLLVRMTQHLFSRFAPYGKFDAGLVLTGNTAPEWAVWCQNLVSQWEIRCLRKSAPSPIGKAVNQKESSSEECLAGMLGIVSQPVEELLFQKSTEALVGGGEEIGPFLLTVAVLAALHGIHSLPSQSQWTKKPISSWLRAMLNHSKNLSQNDTQQKICHITSESSTTAQNLCNGESFPMISESMLENSVENNGGRVLVQFEATRSSSPGGQAANTSETQITAKVLDMMHQRVLLMAEDQSTRSAAQNKALAWKRICEEKRKSWNQKVARTVRGSVILKEVRDSWWTEMKENSQDTEFILLRSQYESIIEKSIGDPTLNDMDYLFLCALYFLSY